MRTIWEVRQLAHFKEVSMPKTIKAKTQTWFRAEALRDDAADITIFGEIGGFGVTVFGPTRLLAIH
jgi:hypothetical protein